ncbi:hypothetical protein DPMN_007950, partial [Dreissena polymorpha]
LNTAKGDARGLSLDYSLSARVLRTLYLDILKIVPEPTMTNQAPLFLNCQSVSQSGDRRPPECRNILSLKEKTFLTDVHRCPEYCAESVSVQFFEDLQPPFNNFKGKKTKIQST